MAEYKIDIEKLAEKILNKTFECFGVPAGRLAELIQADWGGRCVVLPFSVGDTVFTNISVKGDRYLKSHRPYLATVVFVGIGVSETYFNLQYQDGKVLSFDIKEIGETVFVTLEEAEKTLE